MDTWRDTNQQAPPRLLSVKLGAEDTVGEDGFKSDESHTLFNEKNQSAPSTFIRRNMYIALLMLGVIF